MNNNMVTTEVRTKLEISPVTINVLVESGLVPVLRQVNGKVYCAAKVYDATQTQFIDEEFNHLRFADVLEAMHSDGMRPLNAPELLDARLNAAEPGPLMHGSYATTLLATGKTRQGKVVYVVAHRNHPFTDPERIRQGQKHFIKTLWTGTRLYTDNLVLTDREFWALLDMEDGTNSDEKDIYVFTKEEANKQFEFGDGVWSIKAGSPVNYSNRVLTAFVRGEDRKRRLLTRFEKNHPTGLGITVHVEVYDSGTLNDFKEDANRGVNLGTFLRFTNGGYTSDIVLRTGSFGNGTPRFIGVSQFATQKAPGLEEVVETLSGGGLIKPEDTERAMALLGPLYTPLNAGK